MNDKDDLAREDVMILDCFDHIFVWQGPLSSKDEVKEALSTVMTYAKDHPDGRYGVAINLITWEISSSRLGRTNIYGKS